MGTLASALAHERNQPLTAIANYLEAGRDMLDAGGPVDRELLREAMAESANQALRAGEIIRSLREFIKRGETMHQPEPLRGLQIGRAHVCTPVPNAHLVCRLLLEKKKKNE